MIIIKAIFKTGRSHTCNETNESQSCTIHELFAGLRPRSMGAQGCDRAEKSVLHPEGATGAFENGDSHVLYHKQPPHPIPTPPPNIAKTMVRKREMGPYVVIPE